MPDRLFLSVGLPNDSALQVRTAYEKVLKLFPISRLAPRVTARVTAISHAEPFLKEQSYLGEDSLAQWGRELREWSTADLCVEAETAWDLWQKEPDGWRLAPAAVVLLGYGPEFERDQEEQIRIEFGLEDRFLPDAEEGERSLRFVESNVRSLLQLVHDIEKALPGARRRLWSESGGNFAERLQAMLARMVNRTRE
jgi:hypothetical protein